MREQITNLATGDQIAFIQTAAETNGQLSHFIMTLAAKSNWAKSPMHFHPFQKETFKVLSGELNIRVGKEHLVLTPEDAKVIVDEFVPHSFWNEGEETVSFEAEIHTPGNIERGIRLTYELAKEGKINKRNIPYNPFYTLILMSYFDAYFTFLPWKLQRFLFRTGARFASVFGYK